MRAIGNQALAPVQGTLGEGVTDSATTDSPFLMRDP
jgi:hypothetical protein